MPDGDGASPKKNGLWTAIRNVAYNIGTYNSSSVPDVSVNLASLPRQESGRSLRCSENSRENSKHSIFWKWSLAHLETEILNFVLHSTFPVSWSI